MKKPILLFAFFIIGILSLETLQAQVTIGSGREPDKGALLDLKETEDGTSKKGLLLPRVALVSLNDPSPLTEHTAGMYVYNITSEGELTPGNYFNDGQKWNRIKDISTEPWLNFDTDAGATSVGEDIYHMGAVGLGASKNQPSAQVEISSTSKGLLVPRLSKAERDAIVAPANGLIIYNKTSDCINYYVEDITRWLSLCGTYDPATINLVNCDSPVGPSGPLTEGKALSLSDTYMLSVNVAEIGTYEISVRTTNGYVYSKSGLFTSTGNYNIVLEGQGTPVSSGNNPVTVTIDGVDKTPTSCTLPSVQVNPATVEFTVTCNTATAAGTYTATKAVEGTNYIEVVLNVTNPGTLILTTTTNNGLSFSSGSVAISSTGDQTIKLYATGIPALAGTYTYDIMYHGVAQCLGIPVTVTTTKGTFEDPVNRCQDILVEDPQAADDYYWLKDGSGNKFKTYCDMDNATGDAWTLVKSLSERQILVVERSQSESINSQKARNMVTTQTEVFNEYAFSIPAAAVNNIGSGTGAKKFRFSIKEEGHVTTSGATVAEVEASTVSPDNDVWTQDNYWNVTIYSGNPATGDFNGDNYISEGKLFGKNWGKPSSSSTYYYFDGVRFVGVPPGMYSQSNFFTGFYGVRSYVAPNNSENDVTYTYHDRTNTSENGMAYTFNKYYINDLFGLYMNTESQLNHHIGTCANSTDDFGGASSCSAGWNNWRPHNFNQRPDGNYEGRIVQYWVK